MLKVLRKENKKKNRLKEDESDLIDLVLAMAWTRNRMLEIRKEREQEPKQIDLFQNNP